MFRWRILPFALGAGLALPSMAGAVPRPPAVNVTVSSVDAPAGAVAGGQLDFTAQLAAEGDRGATFDWAAYLTVGGALSGAREIGRFGPMSLAAGESASVRRSVRVPADVTGRYRIVVVADVGAAVGETNEYDNAAEASADTHVRSPAADLAIKRVNLVTAEAAIGASVSVEYQLHNSGELPAAVDVSAHVSPDGAISRDDPELARAQVNVPAGATISGTLTGDLPPAIGEGDFTVGVLADPDLRLAEPIELNNAGLAGRKLNVFASQVALETTSLPGGTVFIRYAARLSASGGNGHYTYSISDGRLPRGLSLDGTTGAITGTPLESGTIDVELRVDSHGESDTARLSISLFESGIDLTIVTPDLGEASAGLPYAAHIVAAGGEPPYRFGLASGALPPGLDLNTVGTISGLPSERGQYTFAIQVNDRLGGVDQAEYTVVVEAQHVAISSGELAPVVVGEPIDIPLAATGGLPPYRWQPLSAPPPGLSVTEDGHVVGTPARVGRFAVRVEVTDSTRGEASDTALVHVIVEEAGVFRIATESLAPALIRERVEVKLTAEGGEPPLRWTLVPGDTLPEGFRIAPSETAPDREATIVGSSIRPLEHAFAVEVRDAAGRRREAVYALQVLRPDASSSEGCRCAGGSTSGVSISALLLAGLALVLRRRA